MRRSLGFRLRSIVGFTLGLACLVGCASPAATDGGTDAAREGSTADGGGQDVGNETSGMDVPVTMDVVGTDVPGSDGTSTDRPSSDTATGDGSTADVVARDVPVVSDSGGGPCSSGSTCGRGLDCCAGGCVYLQNDANHCGSCGTRCTGATSMCVSGRCVAPMCVPTCATDEICCVVDGPGPSRPASCYRGTTCPVGCPLCG